MLILLYFNVKSLSENTANTERIESESELQ